MHKFVTIGRVDEGWFFEVVDLIGEPAGTRTQDPRLKRAMLYRLSYRLTVDDGIRNRLSEATGMTPVDDGAAS